MGSGEGYGIAVECTRDSGLELETVGKGGLRFGGKGYTVQLWLQDLKRRLGK
ncbi:hypothetical protein Tco_0436937, partial [Tanacetum coccineum]